MFEELYDALSFLWSMDLAAGERRNHVDVERANPHQRSEKLRLAIAYKFWVGDDGPYTGESFWAPNFFVNKRVIAARRKLRVRAIVSVRYRTDDPSINRLDQRVWRDL